MNKSIPAVLGLSLVSAACAHAQSAWLPKPQEFVVTPAFTYQRFDTFWAGKTETSLKPDDLTQETALLGLEYGVTEFLALDINGGYSWTSTKAPGLGGNKRDDGFIDTTAGVRWRLLDEQKTPCRIMPTLTLRVGGILEGNYDQAQAFSAGDGASGFETSLLVGKSICTGFGAYGDIGYRNRNHNVPDDLFGSVGMYATVKSFTVSVGYRHVQGLSGGDIGGGGFNPGSSRDGFPSVKEISQNIEAGLGYTDKGGRFYQFFYAHTLNGRNTGQKDVFGVSASFPIGGK